ncbi:MAG TPA: hypothetical protein VN442_00620 [Bryobacteraceae bacterium]|nr:hypothetical protein [Bryobacteraceae bacterium]
MPTASVGGAATSTAETVRAATAENTRILLDTEPVVALLSFDVREHEAEGR